MLFNWRMKMKVVKIKISDKENSVKYLLKIENKEVGYGYIFDREVNPIEIYIDKQFQSNGYGKKLFKTLLKEMKGQGVKGMLFEVENENYRFANIISQMGAQEISRNNNTKQYVLRIA